MTLISRREAGKLVGKVMVGGSTAVILGGKALFAAGPNLPSAALPFSTSSKNQSGWL